VLLLIDHVYPFSTHVESPLYFPGKSFFIYIYEVFTWEFFKKRATIHYSHVERPSDVHTLGETLSAAVNLHQMGQDQRGSRRQ